MYINSGYLNNSLVDFQDKSRPLIVGSCGTYQLYTRPKLPTYRPKGRLDFQLLYIASGIAHFYFDHDEKDTVVPAGHMVLYRPKEPQRYVYYGNEQTEVYWVHFTGSSVKKILRSYGITNEMRVLPTGTSLDYARIFKQMIYELQRCQTHYPELLTLLLQQLFILIHRQLTREHTKKNDYLDQEMALAMQFFNDNYNTEVNIEEYAASPLPCSILYQDALPTRRCFWRLPIIILRRLDSLWGMTIPCISAGSSAGIRGFPPPSTGRW